MFGPDSLSRAILGGGCHMGPSLGPGRRSGAVLSRGHRMGLLMALGHGSAHCRRGSVGRCRRGGSVGARMDEGLELRKEGVMIMTNTIKCKNKLPSA